MTISSVTIATPCKHTLDDDEPFLVAKLDHLLCHRQLVLHLLLFHLLPSLNPPQSDKGVLATSGKQEPVTRFVLRGKTSHPVLVPDQLANLNDLLSGNLIEIFLEDDKPGLLLAEGEHCNHLWQPAIKDLAGLSPC